MFYVIAILFREANTNCLFVIILHYLDIIIGLLIIHNFFTYRAGAYSPQQGYSGGGSAGHPLMQSGQNPNPSLHYSQGPQGIRWWPALYLMIETSIRRFALPILSLLSLFHSSHSSTHLRCIHFSYSLLWFSPSFHSFTPFSSHSLHPFHSLTPLSSHSLHPFILLLFSFLSRLRPSARL